MYSLSSSAASVIIKFSVQCDLINLSNVMVYRCATIHLDLPVIDSQGGATKKKRARPLRVIETRMVFADTELKITAVDVSTGELVNVAVDFFNA